MRKKKLRLLAVLLAACMLCSCSAPVYPAAPMNRSFSSITAPAKARIPGSAALAARPVSVPDERPDAVLQQYLTAPAGEGFSLPDGLSSSCAFDSCEDGTLTLLLDETARRVFRASLAAACLTLTMTQLDGVDRVRLVRTHRQTEATYTADQFLLYDASADQPEYAVRLYYPDRDGLLAARDAVVRTADPEQLPLLALQALVSPRGSRESDAGHPLPDAGARSFRHEWLGQRSPVRRLHELRRLRAAGRERCARHRRHAPAHWTASPPCSCPSSASPA